MGSYSTLVRQSLIMGALVVLFAAFSAYYGPIGATTWVLASGATSLAFFIAVSVVRRRQIMRLATEVDEVLHEGRRVDLSSCREGDVAVLSNELAKMVSRLTRTAEQLDQERGALADALADVSHQIRTPLTAMSLMLPAIERADDAADRRRLTRRLEHMIDRVGWLVTTLLRIARLDAGAMHMEKRSVSAAAMIERAVAPLRTAYDLRGIDLVVEADEAVGFQGDERWSAEALENIVKNCMEHTAAGGRVTITAREDALATVVTVIDSGTGIAPEDLPHVFERFYRHGEATEEEMEGFGIGLSLAQALVSAQGGTLRAANEPGAGARFDIAFPKLIV